MHISQLSQFPSEKPLILSANMAHEGKMTQIHFKVKKSIESSEIVLKSKENLHFEAGFHRFNAFPVFSKLFTVNF